LKETSRLAESEIARRVIAQEGSVDEGLHEDPVAVKKDARLKKIYIYADNVFAPQSASDFRIVRVQTPAFDLTGWIDFTQAPQQNQYQTEVWVFLAHNTGGALLQRTGFQGGTLAFMHQMTSGANYISGNHIEVRIVQTYSVDNFATKSPIPYQFIVESR
jgi:hypothetical protein